jgi:hypothetical protein
MRLTSGPAFVNILQKSNKCRVFLRVFNILDEKIREATVIPNSEWGGEGALGATIRFETWLPDQGNVHVMKVFPKSPACEAGLVEGDDFILGTDDATTPTIDYFAKAVGTKTEVTIFVFSSSSGSVRKVTIGLNPNWGGEGSLGCDIADGFLHRLTSSVPADSPPVPQSASTEHPSAPTVMEE